MSSPERKINDLLVRIRQENTSSRMSTPSGHFNNSARPGYRSDRPNLQLENLNNPTGSPVMRRPKVLTFTPKTKQDDNLETEEKLREIMRISGNITIDDNLYKTDIKDMEDLEELGNGTCGHVIKMRHKPSGEIIAVKQMRRSGNSEESKRIIMDIEVVLKSHDCKYIVKCLGCFITEPEVWICMELMETCFDKLLKKLRNPIPENVLGKVTVATVQALSYLKDKHGVIHRDVKPSNILLDRRGNVKLCDFGISGRLVDSMAKTRSAGCAAYMAPERIVLDPNNPDYDIRADVWSLGITLVELATGVFPYRDCKSDFEVLTRVIEDAPPTLPSDQDFTPEFRNFVNCCLIKEKKHRPKYAQLKNDPFIKKYETADVNVGEWFIKAVSQADAVTNATATRYTPLLSTTHLENPPNQRQPQNIQTFAQNSSKLTNGSPSTSHKVNLSEDTLPSSEANIKISNVPDGRTHHVSRLATFRNLNYFNQRDSQPQHTHQRTADTISHQSASEQRAPENNYPRSYSPLQAYHAHLQAHKLHQDTCQPLLQNNVADSGFLQENQYSSPILPRRVPAVTNNTSYYQQRQPTPERRWRSPSSSPLAIRNYLHSDQEQHYNHGNTSPILLQRFHHQQKQQQQAREAEELNKNNLGKKRFASYIKLQLSGDRSGRSSRNQSPDPPPRLNRSISGDQSPLAIRRNYLDSASPSFSRRYISPTPPIPPPRRLSESTSVPGSPQHMRSHFQYTPEPHRRLFHKNDVS